MKNWWRRRSLRVRLAVWFTVVASGILLGLTPVVYALIEHRLHIEFERQLRIDCDLVLARLDADGAGHIQWRPGGAPVAGDLAQAGLWFEVWSEEKQLLLRHWPVAEEKTRRPQPLPAPQGQGERFRTLNLEDGLSARAIEKPAQIGTRAVTLRVFRDESGLHRSLREILIGFALGVPLAALLSALGGYVMAGRTLTPVRAMAEQARQITSESLSQRLPNPNPHDELGRLAAVFNQTLQRLQDSFEALRRFTADASHELRTPLTSLRTVGEVGLRQADNPAALRETIGSMLEEAQRLNDLIDALLTLARMESGKQPVHPEPFRVAALLAEMRETLSVLAVEKQQDLEVDCAEGLMVKADRLLLRQALLNIVHNAIRYAPSRSQITVKACRRAEATVLEVSDQGPGIAPEHRQKVFDRFYRIDESRSRVGGGSGLGLAIAKWSVQHQGGRIEVESEVGKGSTFRILLPG